VPGHPKHLPVVVQARLHLERARVEGLAFDEAWAAMFRTTTTKDGPIIFPHCTADRYAYIEVLRSTRSEWEAAYERRPSALSVAIERWAAAPIDDSTATARIRGEERAALAVVPLPTPSSRPLTREQRSMVAA
jgi:hypothetical protein